MANEQLPSYTPKNSKRRPGVGKTQKVGTTRTSIMPEKIEPGTPRRASVRSSSAPARPSSPPRSFAPARSSSSNRPSSSARSSSLSARSAGGSSKASSRSAAPKAHASQSATAPRTRTIKPKKVFLGFIVGFLLISIAWFTYLYMYGNAKLGHVDALSGRADTPGETYLIVGSDKREKGVVDDNIRDSQRADTIMLLHLPDTGHAALISLPRDTFVDIPGYGPSKINAAYAHDGAKLLVETVEGLTGLTVDHYVEVSMGGVQNLVDAVDGVNLCYDADVSDAYSGMEWTAGCHDVNGQQALSFSRMRYSDPLGDIGRADRQRQVVSKVIDKAVSVDTMIRPWRQRALVGAAAENLTTDTETSMFGLAQAGLGLRSAMGEGGLMGAPPISNMSYWHAGESCVQLNPDKIDDFWRKLERGELTQEDLNQLPGY